jgi:hypothetical protein
MENVPVFSLTFHPVKSLPLNKETQPPWAHTIGAAAKRQSIARFI